MIEMDEDDEILEGRKNELFTFDSRYNNYTLRWEMSIEAIFVLSPKCLIIPFWIFTIVKIDFKGFAISRRRILLMQNTKSANQAVMSE